MLPGALNGQHFAVGWDGLVRPVTKVGAVADFRKDVLAVIADDEAFRTKFVKERPGTTFERGHDREVGEDCDGFSHKSLKPLKACLLLRLGHGDLATRFWTTWKIGVEFADRQQTDSDPYALLAKAWIDSLLDLSLGAHFRGDDKLALSSARKLVAIRPAIEVEEMQIAEALVADSQRRIELRKAGKARPSWIRWQADDSNPWRTAERNLAEHLKHFPEKRRSPSPS